MLGGGKPVPMGTQPPLVDDNGDIFLHGRQGAELILEFLDAAGNPRDMSTATVTFEVGPTINHALVPVVGQLAQMKLTLTQADVKAIFLASDKEFVFLETAPAAEPTPQWTGVVYASGWVE